MVFDILTRMNYSSGTLADQSPALLHINQKVICSLGSPDTRQLTHHHTACDNMAGYVKFILLLTGLAAQIAVAYSSEQTTQTAQTPALSGGRPCS